MSDPFSIAGDPEPELVAVDHEVAPNVVHRVWGTEIDSSAGIFATSPAPEHVVAGPSAGTHPDPAKGA